MIIIVVIILVYSFVDEKVENCENDNRKEAHHKEVSHLRKNIDKCIFNVYNYIYTTYTIIYSIYMYIPFVPNVQSCNLKLPICSRSSSSSPSSSSSSSWCYQYVVDRVEWVPSQPCRVQRQQLFVINFLIDMIIVIIMIMIMIPGRYRERFGKS